MRFLFLTQYFAPEIGASQVRLLNVAQSLISLGHEVRVITAMPNHPTGRVFPAYQGKRHCRETVQGIPVERTWVIPVKEAGFRRLLSYASFQYSSFWPLLRETKRFRPDFVFTESPPLFLGASAVLLRQLTGTPFIFNIADLWPDWAADMGLIRRGSAYYRAASWLESLIYRKSAYLSVVVENMKQALRAKGVADRKVLFLPNGADLVLYSPEPRPLVSEAARAIRAAYRDRDIILYAGTHGRYHGLEVVIDAARLLEGRSRALFLFVGDGSAKPNLVAYAKRMGVGNVIFHNPVSPQVIAELLQLSCIALSVIRIPTRAAKILPAMAAGRPIVYAGAGEGAELVRDAEAGLVVAPDDAVALVGALTQLLDDPTRAATLGRNGRAHVERYYDWNQLVADWLAQLHSRSGASREAEAAAEAAAPRT